MSGVWCVVHVYRTADGTADAFIIIEDVAVALANVGVMCWGTRIEVHNMQAYDVTRGVELLSESWVADSLVRINTDNSVNGWSGWPFSSSQKYWESFPIKGFEVRAQRFKGWVDAQADRAGADGAVAALDL